MWLFPDAAHRTSSTAAWLGLFAEQYLAGLGPVDVVDGDPLTALAAWRLPGATPPPPTLPSLPGLLAALVGTARAAELGAALAALGELRPASPHAYLHFLAVDPDAQRQGHGRALLRLGLDRLAGTGLPVHLETTNPAALPFYAACGFSVGRSLRLAADGPVVHSLARAAR